MFFAYPTLTVRAASKSASSGAPPQPSYMKYTPANAGSPQATLALARVLARVRDPLVRSVTAADPARLAEDRVRFATAAGREAGGRGGHSWVHRSPRSQAAAALGAVTRPLLLLGALGGAVVVVVDGIDRSHGRACR